MRKTPWTSSVALVLLLTAPVHAGETDSALETFTHAYAEIDALVHTQTKSKAKRIQTKVDALLDYHWITVATLGGPKGYAERCADRCAELESLLGELIRRNYLARLESRPEGQVEILRQHVRPKASKVDTRVSYNDEDGKPKTASVDYVMHRVDGRWRVRDILTEGTSLAENCRYEVNELYVHGGIDEVVTALRKKLAELDAKK